MRGDRCINGPSDVANSRKRDAEGVACLPRTSKDPQSGRSQPRERRGEAPVLGSSWRLVLAPRSSWLSQVQTRSSRPTEEVQEDQAFGQNASSNLRTALGLARARRPISAQPVGHLASADAKRRRSDLSPRRKTTTSQFITLTRDDAPIHHPTRTTNRSIPPRCAPSTTSDPRPPQAILDNHKTSPDNRK